MIGVEPREIEYEDEKTDEGSKQMSIMDIPLNKIKLAKNSRMSVSAEDLSELMSSIKEQGLLQPVGVVKSGTGYELCYGNRRFLAYSKLGKSTIPCIIQTAKTAADVDLKNLTENIQRRNISLTEIGRYISILNKDGLSLKEVAVRLGVANSYVSSCLDAFQNVPKEYRKDLEIRNNNRKKTPGKIPINIATKIESASKSHRLTVDQKKTIYQAAKNMDGFIAENIPKYAMAISSGEKDFLKKVVPLKQVVVRFLMSQDEYDRLERAYVANGPYKGIGPLLASILSGKRTEKVKIANY